MSEQLPGKGFLGWLGRQVGHVKRAAKTDVTAKTDEATKTDAAAKKIYEQKKIDESPHPQDPSLLLRRTTIDEAIKRPDPNQPD